MSDPTEPSSATNATSDASDASATSDASERATTPRSTPPASARGPVVRLPRGGTYVKTRAGGVQIGMPPETIKDVLSLELELPALYVVPSELFDVKRGMNVAEAEFPAYYSFFARHRRLRLGVCDAATEARLRVVFGESLFGPAGRPRHEGGRALAPTERDGAGAGVHGVEFAPDVPLDVRPDFAREAEHFRRLPDGRRLDVDVLVEFVRVGGLTSGSHEGLGPTELGDGVAVAWDDESDCVVVLEDGVELARVAGKVELPERPERAGPRSAPGEVWSPPSFGVTVLGASHGFDPKGKTTGFLVWLGGRGLLVDPPVDATELLHEHGVPQALIDGVVLTHCHADHDSGTLQKLLEERRVSLYTTPTILGSFLRKYSAITGMSEDVLRRTFTFCPVTIGAPVHVGAAELWFFYTLHSIPALGFEAYCGGRSLVISGDSLYDPERIAALQASGVLSRGRAEALLAFPFHHSLVLHEAGVPPIHTPVSVLAKLPDDVKSRLYLVHIADRDVPTETGLRAAKVGLEHTLALDVTRQRYADAIEILDAFTTCELFRDLPLARAKEVLAIAERVERPAGATIIHAGERGRELYVVVRGLVAVERDGATLRTYGAGDFFGETAILRGQPRNADVVARSPVTLLEIDGHGFSYLVRGSDVWRRLERLARMREERSWEVFAASKALRRLSTAQKTQLQTRLEVVELVAGHLLWHAGEVAESAFLLDDAEVVLDGVAHDPAAATLAPFGRGALLGEIDALLGRKALATSARVTKSGRAFRIGAADLERFFSDNPGVLLAFLGARFVE